MNVVIAQTVALNGGDAAILFGLLDSLRRAFGDVNVTVFDSQPQIASRLYPELDFRKLLWHQVRTDAGRAALRVAARAVAAGRGGIARLMVGATAARDLQCYADADLVIWTGGTYLVEHYDLRPRFFELDVLRAFDVPLLLFTQSAGPFDDRRHRARVAELGERAHHIMTRDERTLGHFVAAGVPREKLEVCADGAFALPRPDVVVAGGVLISVRSWPHASSGDVAERYIDAHARAVERLCDEHDVDVTFVSTCQGVPEYWANDSDTAVRIVARLPDATKRRVVVDDRFHTPLELLELYGGAQAVIATRMHAAILSLVAGAPVLPVAYEFKTHELFAQFGQGELVQELEEIDPEEFAQWAVDSFAQRRALQAAQQVGTEELCRSAARFAQRFANLESSV